MHKAFMKNWTRSLKRSEQRKPIRILRHCSKRRLQTLANLCCEFEEGSAGDVCQPIINVKKEGIHVLHTLFT
jgi:hypothetical protein